MNTSAMLVGPGPLRDQLSDAYIELFLSKNTASFGALTVWEWAKTEVGKSDVAANAYQRYNNTVEHVLPWVQRVFDLRGKRVLEIGGGTGSSAAAIGQLAGEVFSVEPIPRSINVAKLRAELLRRDNVRFMEGLFPLHVARIREAFPPPYDAIFFPAVLEHMTIAERQEGLKLAWEMLRPGGVLVMLETPNRLTYMDGHTSWLMFYDVIESDLAIHAFPASSREGFVNVMRMSLSSSEENAKMSLVRAGRGVCYYDFDCALGGRPYNLLADGYEPEPMTLFGVTYEERLLQSCVAKAKLDIPAVFLRHTMYGIFQKPADSTPGTPPPKRDFSPFAATAADLASIQAALQTRRGRKKALALVQSLITAR